MVGSVLTPVSVWNDFFIENLPVPEVISEEKINGLIISRFYLNGKTVQDGTVKIYAVSVKPETEEVLPAVFVTPDFNDGVDEGFLIEIAKEGYFAIAFDLGGKVDGKDYFTIYPESLAYANFKIAENNLFSVEIDVKHTCWYEWGSVAKYVLEYVKNIPFIKGIAGLGVATAGSVLWHISANEKAFFCLSFLFNAGWETYRGKYKTENEESVPTDMSDEMLKYLAGIEPEAYAPYVTCPIYLISATNSEKFECDRAADTLARVKPRIYTALDYSINHCDFAERKHFDNIMTFFNRVFNSQRKLDLPKVPEIDCDVKDGQIFVCAKATDNPKKIRLYSAEQTEIPQLRSWIKVGEKKPDAETGEICFNYAPYQGSNKVFFFVQAEYDAGFTLSSAIVMKKFDQLEIKTARKLSVIFSGRDSVLSSTFVTQSKLGLPIDYTGTAMAKIKKGPMEINGVYSKEGLITYKINADKDKPNDDAVLMLDVYVKEDAEFKMILLVDLNKETYEEYSYIVSLKGGKVWHNLKIELPRFKSKDGLLIKNYSSVNAIKVSADKDYLINNFLWV